MRWGLVLSMLVAGGLNGMVAPPPASAKTLSPSYVESEIKRLAADFAHDPSMRDMTFGIEVDGNVWTVDAKRGAEGQPSKVTVSKGEPKGRTWINAMSGETFKRIMDGKISAYTATVRARSTDVTLMNTRYTGGLTEREFDESGADLAKAALSHFWTTGVPEIIPYGFEGSKLAHGAQVSVLHYGPQLRSGWFGILQGQHANKDPSDQTNPFPTMIIIEKGGTGMARIAGKEIKLKDKTMIMVPANMTHELWNPGPVPVEGFLVMFGSGA